MATSGDQDSSISDAEKHISQTDANYPVCSACGFEQRVSYSTCQKSRAILLRRWSVLATCCLVACFTMTLADRSQAAPVKWSQNGHFYDIIAVPGGITWADAQADAIARGGYLATIQSAAENDFIFQNLVNNPAYWSFNFSPPYSNQAAGPWIGAFQPPGSPEPAGGWQWVHNDGLLVNTYANWLPAEPSNSGGLESAALFYDNDNSDPPKITSQWNDWRQDELAPSYVIEFDVEPSSPSVFPNKGGDTGSATVRISGRGFIEGATVKLVRAGQPDIVGDPVRVDTDGRAVATTFNLVGKQRGLWDVVVTNPDGTPMVFPDGFTIEEGRAPEIWVDIIGRDVTRVGRLQTLYVLYGNRGNIDAQGVPIWIRLPKGAEWNLKFKVTPPPSEGQVPIDWSQVPIHLETDNDILIPLLIPRVLPGSQTILAMDIAYPMSQDFEIRAWANPPMFQFSGEELSLAQEWIECLTALASAALKMLGPFIPGYECTEEILKAFPGTALNTMKTILAIEQGDAVHSLPQFFVGVAMTAAQIGVKCAKDLTFLTKLISALATAVQKVLSLVDAFKECSEAIAGTQAYVARLPVRVVDSYDPNDKVGSYGVTPSKYLSGREPLRYTVFFENLETATAPAQEVVITDQLDTSKMDPSTLSFGPIAFGSKQVIPPPAASAFAADVDLRPDKNLIVRTTASLNPTTGLLTCHLISIDPATGNLPTDPWVGFLPPDVHPPEGDGSVLFTVMPKAGLATGTEVPNQASIVFDVNPPLLTPQWLNTLDNSKPVSQVQALAATQNSASFLVEWSGTDEGAGIRDYTIYVSDDGGPFTPWLIQTTGASANFVGLGGHNYSFYSLARDLTGNVEETKTAGEAGTLVVAPEAQFSATSLTFASQLVGSSSAAQAVSLTNPGNAPLTISGITVSGDFTQTNTCGVSLGAGGSCAISVTFSPKATGSREGTLTIATNAYGGLHTVDLSGPGTDIALAVASGGSNSITVNAGQTATYNLQIEPMGYAGTVSVSCTWANGQPHGTSCTVSPSTVNLDGSNASPFTVAVSTTRRSLALGGPKGTPPPPGRNWPLLLWLLMITMLARQVAVAAVCHRRRGRGTVSPTRTPALQWVSVGVAVMVVVLWTTCGGGGGGSAPPPPPQTGTPAGTYSLTVTATSAGVSKTTSLTLMVN